MFFYKMIAACGGAGYLKGGGTIASVLYTIFWCLIRPSIYTMPAQLIVFLLVTAIGVFLANKLEPVWGKDSSKIVIDEVSGMCCTLLFVPFNWHFALAGLILFRLFDIIKPFFISKVEKLPAGWGVMGDDVVAGIYANVVLQLIILTNIL